MMTILLVDDDRMSLELVKRKLIDNGYDVMTAGDGEIALGCLQVKIPNLIVLDVEMPVMNGYSFITQMHKIPECSNIPVIMLTAHQETEPLFKRHRVKAYMIKPLNMNALLAKISEILGTTLQPPPQAASS